MFIKGIVKDGKIQIDVQGILPESTHVLITPIDASQADFDSQNDLESFKAKILEIANLPSMSPDDGFSGADHDKILYHDAE